ncbi:hypothetical protein LFL96_25785 [Paraburkholderia sp. D15]|uniref:hypothetical protein n=1 Tax=Paraburkholderia sp. D15 TaxID=2880218 RepID=UPI0024789849|nr:hypothetical protein [Paraburkholderia sp. D15]WGS54427.1 hypothetical protein LFL96_25785 [Paraburkholderia sp. D15]
MQEINVPQPDLNDPSKLSDKQVLERIESLTAGLMKFWKEVKGWAPDEAAALLKGSMLEWQTSLAVSLKRWPECKTEGDLVLAWTNLGSLAEGALKLVLCAYLKDYFASSKKSVESKGLKKGKTEAEIEELKKKINSPDGLMLEPLKVFFAEHIWSKESEHHKFIEEIQFRRNAIHAFQKKDIGTFEDFKKAIRRHLLLLRRVNDMLPYPDDIYKPVEKGWFERKVTVTIAMPGENGAPKKPVMTRTVTIRRAGNFKQEIHTQETKE